MVELEDAQYIAVSFVKDKKDVAEVLVTITEQKDGIWIVKGTCPVDLCGHPWRETFEVRIDKKGKIKESNFKLM